MNRPPLSRLLRAAALLAAGWAAVLPPSPPAAAEGDGLPDLRAPLRLGTLERRGAVSFRHSASALGRAGDAFDGKPATFLRTRSANPAFLEVSFREPVAVDSAQALFGEGAPHEWSLLAGEDADHLEVVFRQRRVDPGAWSRVVPFHPPLRAKVLRVVVLRLDGADGVEIREIALESRQFPESVEVVVPSDVAAPGGMLPARARVLWNGGQVTTGVHGLRFETSGEAGLRVEPVGPWDPDDVMLRFEKPGAAAVRAAIPGRGGFRLRSPWREVRCEPEGRPDWCLTFIERTPRIDHDAPGGGWPAPGSHVLWVAHVRNYGTVDAPRSTVRWEVDGKIALEEGLPGLRRFAEATASLRLPWDGKRREIRCTVDPLDAVPETSEGNNSRAVASDALLLGLWVERPLPTLFHGTQASFGDGANGVEDWAQRQVDRWNRMLAEARFPLTPGGVTDRVALDRVVFVEEGGLPLAGGLPASSPDARDRTVDLAFGLPETLAGEGFFARPGARDDGNPLWIDFRLLHDLSRARALVDLDRLSVRVEEVALPGPAGLPLAGSALLPAAGGLLHRTASGRMMAGDLAGGYGPHSALGLQRIAGLRGPAGEGGAYLGDLPDDCGIRVQDPSGRGLDGVAVRAWRRAPGPDGIEVFAGDPVRTGTTREGGHLSLLERGRDPFFEGERGRGLDPGRGVLLLELSRGGASAWRFLEVVPFNLALWGGSRTAHWEPITVELP